MNRTAAFSTAHHKATMTSGIFRVILDNLTRLNYSANFCCADHTFRPAHLTKVRSIADEAVRRLSADKVKGKTVKVRAIL